MLIAPQEAAADFGGIVPGDEDVTAFERASVFRIDDCLPYIDEVVYFHALFGGVGVLADHGVLGRGTLEDAVSRGRVDAEVPGRAFVQGADAALAVLANPDFQGQFDRFSDVDGLAIGHDFAHKVGRAARLSYVDDEGLRSARCAGALENKRGDRQSAGAQRSNVKGVGVLDTAAESAVVPALPAEDGRLGLPRCQADFEIVRLFRHRRCRLLWIVDDDLNREHFVDGALPAGYFRAERLCGCLARAGDEDRDADQDVSPITHG